MTERIMPELTNRFTYVSVGLLVAGTTATGLAASTSAHAATDSAEHPVTGRPTDNPVNVHAATEKALQAVARNAKVARPTTVASHRGKVHRKYRVRPGETLSEIARTQLGDAGRYQEIFDLNKGKPQPGGRHLTAPDLIEPGWILELPSDVRAKPITHDPIKTQVTKRHAKRASAKRPSTPAATRNTSSWAAPVATSHRIGYGYGIANSGYSAGHHTGIDFPVPVGTPVHAVSNGTVVFAGWGGAYGNLIKIRDNDGRYSLYAHLSRIDVSVGEHISAANRIALSGASGHATGPHLHFEVDTTLQYGSDINPVTYLAAHGIHL
ncbi:peptidoglycan DD-metalloendopeptidase family protein [Streptomyces sp. NPDC048527]|uniref:M23 family metallopeptidase n=1 Tax=Streptomyces sp. NPDC048527 TaxID=3365568 RepID=UPI00371F49D6